MQQQPNKKKFDFATIAVIIVSIGLILGGFYLLNQSFTGKQKATTSTTTTKSSESSSSKSAVSSSIQTSSSAQNLSSSSTAASSALSSNSVISSSSSSSVSSSNSVTGSSISSTSSTATSSNLTSEQALIKVISIEGSQYQIETVDTGYKDGRLWKVGKQLKITSTKPLSADKQYLVSDISEGANSVQFGSIVEK